MHKRKLMMELPKDIQLSKSITAPIVHVDDDDIFIDVVKRYHSKSKIENPYIPFTNGDDLIEYLHKRKKDNKELPLLVLLDINMPGKDGFEVLEEIRSVEAFKVIPICSMLSSSSYELDIKKSKETGANSYLVKPDNAKEYLEFFDKIAQIVSE